MTRTPRNFPALLAVALVAALATGCGSGSEQPAPADLPNVVLVCIDTLRADHLGCYGYPRPTSPHLDALAARGLRFERAYATAPWTLPSVSSMFTGLPPDVHRAVDFLTPVSPEAALFTETLEAAGFQTGAAVSNRFFQPEYGLDRGFEHYDRSCLADRTSITSPCITDAALQWLETEARPGFFLYLHYFDPHYDYHEHDGFSFGGQDTERVFSGADIWKMRDRLEEFDAADRERLCALYDSEVAFTDHHLGRVLEALERSPFKDNTLIAVCADHGEELGEHGWIGHTLPLYEETVRVPLIVAGPGVRPGVSEQVIQIDDLAPTLLEYLGLDAPAHPRAGQSFLAALRGEARAPEPRPAWFSVETTAQQPRRRSAVVDAEESPVWRLLIQEDEDGAEVFKLFKDDEPPGRRKRDPVDHPKIVEQLLQKRERDFERRLAENQAAVSLRRGVRDGSLKLIADLASGRDELYDLAADPGETVNLAAEQPGEVRRLLALLEERHKDLERHALVSAEMSKAQADLNRRLLEQIGYARAPDAEIDRRRFRLLLADGTDAQIVYRIFEWNESDALPERAADSSPDLQRWAQSECENHVKVQRRRGTLGRGDRAWVAWPFKYLRGADGGESLFLLSEDPAEQEDLATERPVMTRNLRQQLDRALRQPAPLEPATSDPGQVPAGPPDTPR